MIWETPHLYLRELTEADLPQLMEMMNGQRNFYERQFSQSELQNWLTRQQQRYRQNFGIWGVCRKDDDTLIGQAGLTFQRFGRRMLWEDLKPRLRAVSSSVPGTTATASPLPSARTAMPKKPLPPVYSLLFLSAKNLLSMQPSLLTITLPFPLPKPSAWHRKRKH